MELISGVRLINRALVKEGDGIDRLCYWNRIIQIAEEFGLAIRGGTQGGFIDGPFIEAIYTRNKNDILEVKKFAKFLKSIMGFLDMYNGVKPYTQMEMSVKYIISKDSTTIKKQTHLGIWYDLNLKESMLRAVDSEKDAILPVNLRLQMRLTQNDINEALKNSVIFTKPVEEPIPVT